MFNLEDLQSAAGLVYRHMNPTPQITWPLLRERLGLDVVVKHENHTPAGAFKIRGGITFIDWLQRHHPDCPGIVTATRGNHGQSQARAASNAGLSAKIFVPHGNSQEKNAAMRAFGAEVIEVGNDFDDAKQAAFDIAETEGLWPVPAFDPALLIGVATYAYELMTAHSDLDVLYVPIGCGSGICANILVRDLLGLKTEIVGVVSDRAKAAKLSTEAGHMIETESANTFADGMAVRVPVEAAFNIYKGGASRIITVSDDEIAHAMRVYYTDTHNLAEGAGAATLAALMQEKDRYQGGKAGVVLSGGNIDLAMYRQVLTGETPRV